MKNKINLIEFHENFFSKGNNLVPEYHTELMITLNSLPDTIKMALITERKRVRIKTSFESNWYLFIPIWSKIVVNKDMIFGIDAIQIASCYWIAWYENLYLNTTKEDIMWFWDYLELFSRNKYPSVYFF